LANKLIIKGIILPLVIPTINSMVNDKSFSEPKILLEEEINSGGIPEKPSPVSTTPKKFIFCVTGKIARINPIRLITDNTINKVPALNLYDKKLIISLPASMPIQNTDTIRLALYRSNNFSTLKKVGAQEKIVTSDMT